MFGTSSQRQVSVLLPRIVELFILEQSESAGDAFSGVAGADDAVNIAALGGAERA